MHEVALTFSVRIVLIKKNVASACIPQTEYLACGNEIIIECVCEVLCALRHCGLKAMCRTRAQARPALPLVSATLIGCLAIAKERRGQRLRAVLLPDALRLVLPVGVAAGSA
jgi:hypothetical protein